MSQKSGHRLTDIRTGRRFGYSHRRQARHVELQRFVLGDRKTIGNDYYFERQSRKPCDRGTHQRRVRGHHRTLSSISTCNSVSGKRFRTAADRCAKSFGDRIRKRRISETGCDDEVHLNCCSYAYQEAAFTGHQACRSSIPEIEFASKA